MQTTTINPHKSIESVVEDIRYMLKKNQLCCCAADGSFTCNNCTLACNISPHVAGDGCPNCARAVKVTH